jgi:uncharacterized protein
MLLLQLVPSRVCLQCDVCCRFPEAGSFLRPYFTAEEIRRAVAGGIDPAHFPDPNGSQVSVVPNPSGEGYLCPAFDPATSHCRIYEDRPLDCQIYPLALMWSPPAAAGKGRGAGGEGQEVVLGWDSKCPFMKESIPQDIKSYAERIAAILERDDMIETIVKNPCLVGRFQEDVVILHPLPKLSERVTRHSSLVTRPLAFADRPRLERACATVDSPLAHYAFAPHVIWSELFRYSWAEREGHFCLFAEYSDGMFMPLPPLPLTPALSPRGRGEGEGNFEPAKAALAACFALMRETNKGSAVSRIENVPEEWRTALESWGYRVKPKDPDYLYRTADLAALAGDRYKSQRAACNRFERECRHSFEPYRDSDRDACLTLFREWVAQKQAAGLGEAGRHMLADSEAAHREALMHHRALGLSGYVVLVEGRVRAYTFGYARSSSVFCVLLEVADRTIAGLATFIFREFAREAAGRGHEFMNTMDDSGLPSLARSKRAYHPLRLVPSYIVTEP